MAAIFFLLHKSINIRLLQNVYFLLITNILNAKTSSSHTLDRFVFKPLYICLIQNGITTCLEPDRVLTGFGVIWMPGYQPILKTYYL